jgi:hypothetical protein
MNVITIEYYNINSHTYIAQRICTALIPVSLTASHCDIQLFRGKNIHFGLVIELHHHGVLFAVLFLHFTGWGFYP